MAFLLGTQSCIDSLRSDLKDIQDTIDEILVRTGPIKCYSWKSPDKLVTDLKIKDLMDRYAFGKDEVDNQIAHYSLLELIVDRLLLLIHLSTLYSDTSLNSTDIASLTSGSKTSSLSAGLNVKKFWNKFTLVCSTLRQEKNKSSATITAKKKTSYEDVRSSKAVFNQDESAAAKIIYQSSPVQQQVNNNIASKHQSSSSSSSSSKPVSVEVSTKSVQTAETAFVPCESCAKIQTNLKQNADLLINMCHYQNLTSQVGKYRATLMSSQLVGGWLSGADLDKWLIEQDKDLNRISKQLDFLSKNNELLQGKLKDNEVLVQKMTQNEKDLKKAVKEEQDSRVTTTKQYEKKLTDQKSELGAKITTLETELANLKKIKTSLEEKYEALKNLNDNNEKIILELNETNRTLSNELNARCEQLGKVQAGEEEKKIISKELECLKRELSEKSQELTNERTKIENLIRNEQSLKLKYDSTLESMDKLTADFEELKRKFGYVDDEKKQLLANIKHRENDVENLKYEAEILQSSLDTLKLELKKQKENETLLLKYPDLYGPLPDVAADIEANVATDMQNQINANKHRIYLLNTLNKKLENSLRKLNEIKGRTGNDESAANKSNVDADGDGRNSNTNYFVKQQSSTTTTPKSNEEDAGSRMLRSRPVPFYKLDSEIDNLKTLSTQKDLKSQSKYKNLSSDDNDDEYENDDLDEDLDNDDHYDFLKEKHDADKSLVSRLNQITNESELLRVDSTALPPTSATGSRRGGTFLYTQSPPSIRSRPSSNRRQQQQQQTATTNSGRLVPIPIPPAEKNMEVVIGRGRRLNSASSSRSGTNSATGSAGGQRKASLNSTAVPPLPPPSSTTNTKNFVCGICNKKYSNPKDLDIHKLYCIA